MKKVTAIFLLFLFLIANSGMVVSVHYCGGSLASIDFFSGEKHNCPCGEKPMKDNCCEDYATILKASDEVEKGKYRTAWGYAGGIEFYPMESNLHFFLAYVGRSYKYTDRAKALGEDNFSTHRVSVGFIWQMPVC